MREAGGTAEGPWAASGTGAAGEWDVTIVSPVPVVPVVPVVPDNAVLYLDCDALEASAVCVDVDAVPLGTPYSLTDR